MTDVNILIYAHRSDAQEHAWYRDWWDGMVNSGKPFAVSTLVAVAFVRIVTQPSYAHGPTGLSQALAVIDALTRHPRCRLLGPGPQHWTLCTRLCRLGNATGKLVADAQHAAVALEHGCTWVSRDTDYDRFTRGGLQWKHLLPGSA